MAGRIQDWGAAGPRRGSSSTGGRGGRAHRAPTSLLPLLLCPAICCPHRFLLPSPPLQPLGPRPGAPQLGGRPLPGRGQPGRTARSSSRVGVRLFYFCVSLPPLPLSCRLALCSSAPSCTCHLPALQPADERSWVYSPLHYSTQAPPASDGESDTVSAPTARSLALRRPEDRWGDGVWGGRAGLGSPCGVACGESSGLCPALTALGVPGPVLPRRPSG